MSKKNIWIINQFAGTLNSGWGERHYFLSKYWLQQGYHVTIISGSYNHIFDNLPHAPNQFNHEDVEGTKFCWVKTPFYKPESGMRFWSFLVFSFKIYFLPHKKIGRPDVILISSMPIFPILTGFLLRKKFLGSKLIFEIRDVWPLTLVQLGSISPNHLLVRFIGWFERFGYKNADHIVSLLPNVDKHISEIAGTKKISKWIPNGIDEKLVGNSLLNDLYFDSIPKNKFIIGYAGTIGMANAMECIIDSAEMLKLDSRFHFVIVGDGYLKRELEQKSKNFGNITFLPKVKKDQVQSVLKFFDICIISWHNSPLYKLGVSANKYFDYMLAGKPILASNNLIKDPVELSGCGIIVKPNSPKAIKEGIIELYNMPKDQREKMGEKGKIYVSKFHSVKNLAELYTELF